MTDQLAYQPKSPTSLDAANGIATETRGQRSRVYQDLRENGAATAEAIANRMGLRYDSAKARVYELRELDLVHSIGTAKTSTGYRAELWAPIVRDDADKVLAKPRCRKAGRVTRLLAAARKVVGASHAAKYGLGNATLYDAIAALERECDEIGGGK